MEKYAKEVTAPEQEIMPNKMFKTYFEEIYKPTEFSPKPPGQRGGDSELEGFQFRPGGLSLTPKE